MFGRIDLDNVGDVSEPGTLDVRLTGFDASTLVVEAQNTAVACVPTGTGTVRCPVPTLGAGAFGDPNTHDAIWSFQVQQTSPAATTPAITFDLEPAPGPDANPADDTSTTTFAIKASADLQTSITPAPALLVAGSPSTFTLTVHNAGPDTAPATTSVAVLQTNDDGFTVASGDPAVVVTSNGAFSTVTWTVGDLAAGASRSTTFTVTASVVGATADIGVVSRSAATDHVPCTDRACDVDQGSHVTVVAAAPPGNGRGTGTGSGRELANTGVVTGPAAGLGLGLLAAGTVVLLGARRRVRG